MKQPSAAPTPRLIAPLRISEVCATPNGGVCLWIADASDRKIGPWFGIDSEKMRQEAQQLIQPFNDVASLFPPYTHELRITEVSL